MKNKLESIAERIDIWSLHLPGLAGEADPCRGLLTEEERGRATRFLRPADAAAFILSRGMLRRILGGYLECAPSAIRFDRNGNGKPFLKGHPLEFNLSHSRDRALIAVTANRRVGIDIEFRRQGVRREDIAARWFAPEEQDCLRAAKDPGPVFFDIWAGKEAYVKARGASVYRDFNTFSVPLCTRPEFPCAGTDGRWIFQALEIAPDYSAVLVSEAPAVPVRLRGADL